MSIKKVLVKKNKMLLLSEYLDEIYQYLLEFLNKIKEPKIGHKI